MLRIWFMRIFARPKKLHKPRTWSSSKFVQLELLNQVRANSSCSLRLSLHKSVYLKLLLTQLENVYLQSPCCLRPFSSMPYCKYNEINHEENFHCANANEVTYYSTYVVSKYHWDSRHKQKAFISSKILFLTFPACF